jgi:hypothetical protein
VANQRWKTSEREFATKLQKAAGRVTDPKLAPLVTITGRVGHLTELGFDILVGEGATALCGEAKRRKAFLSADATRALLQIDRIGNEWDRVPVLGFRLADDIPSHHEGQRGKRYRVNRNWLVMPLPFAERTIAALRFIEEHGHWAAFTHWLDEELGAADTQDAALARV